MLYLSERLTLPLNKGVFAVSQATFTLKLYRMMLQKKWFAAIAKT
jgi:hypothetical protein